MEYRLRIMCHANGGDRIDGECSGNKFFIHAASEEEAMDEAESIIKRCVGEYLRKDEEKKVGWVSATLLSGAVKDSKSNRFLILERKESGFVVQFDIPIVKTSNQSLSGGIPRR